MINVLGLRHRRVQRVFCLVHVQGMQAIVADRLRAQLRDIGTHLSKVVGGGECTVSASPSTAGNHLVPSAGGLGTAYVAASEARIKSSATSNSRPLASEEDRAPCLSSSAASSSPMTELDAAAVAQSFFDKAGFALKVAPSSIAHLESGAGLWLQGMAQMGQVRSLITFFCAASVTMESIFDASCAFPADCGIVSRRSLQAQFPPRSARISHGSVQQPVPLVSL